MHVPPGARRLQPVHLGFDVRSSCRHVERPGLVGVDPRYPAVHALHLKVGCRRRRVNLSNEGGLGGRHFALHRRRRRGGEGVKARGSSACKRGLLRGVRYRQIQDVGVACAHPIRERSGGWRRVSCESRGRNRARFLLLRRGAGEAAPGQRLKSGSRLIDVSCREPFLPFGVKTWKLRRGARWRWAI